MADISKVTVGSTTYNIKDSTARTHISNTDIHTTAAEKSDWNSKASGTHTHGNITNGGDITSNVAIASGDRLVINDESASKIDNSSITFGTSETEFLTNKGTWKTPSGTTYSAGTGLSLNNTTFNHSNSITAGTAGTSTATLGTTTLAVPYVTYDAQGHITASGTHTHTISSFPEAYLTWGGRNFSSSYGPIDAAMIDVLGANRFAFLKAAGLTVEYSTDNGTNWSDYGATDLQKVGLFSSGQSFYLGKHTATGSCTVNDLLRVTISTSPAGLYTVLNKIAIYMSTSGSTVDVKIEKALESTPTSFSTHLDWTPISGWSGWNILNISGLTTYGNTAASQYGRIRFIFRATKVNTNYSAANISKIMGFGGVGWTTPSNMAATGHLYSFDAAQNATFPSKVTATSFSGDLSKDKILLNGSKYYESASTYVMNFNNSDVIGLNGMYFVDAADGVGEGIHFYRDSSHWDSIRAYSGNLQFSPNRSNNTAGTWYNVYHTNNKPALSDLSGDATHRLVTDTQITNWDTAYSNSHTHSNKSALDAITSTKMTNWDNAATNSHTHSNKSVLDGITSAKVSSWDGKQSALTEGTDYLNKTHLDNTYVAKTSVGANSGIAELDSTGKVPSSQLPSFVDDVLEYASQSAFPTTGEAGKIYIAQDTNKTYRWSGSAYVEISASLALGETSSTAYRGDRGKTAYDHSQNGDVHVTTTQKTNWNTAYSNSHTHSNKTVLDGITSTKVSNWDGAATNSHTHSNKTALDAITSTKMTNWDTAYTNSHTHSNKANLDAITATKMTNWDTAYTNSHSHSNKAVLDTVTSAVVSNSHTHSNKTALDAITSTKMTNWDTAYSNSHSHTNKSVLDGISSTDVSNWNSKVPSTRTVNSKALSSDIILSTGDIPPISTKTYTGLIGSADDHAGAGFYFGKIQPTSYNDIWAIKYQIEIWAPAEARCHAIADVIIIGSQNTYKSYMAFNGILNTDYRPAYHHLIYCAKEAGITANKGHALGVGLRASWKSTDATYPRTCIVKLYDQINCIVTLNDTAVKWANWDGTGSTNYNTYYELNFSGNGLQETGDSAPEYAYYFSHSYSNILAKAAQYRYCLAVQYDENHMLPLNSVSNNTGTSKTMTTESFDPFGKIIYWGTTTTVAAEAAYGRYYQYQQYTDFNACYTFNCGSTLTVNKAVYLVCVPQSDGKVKLHTTPWSQTLPTTEDGLVYIYLGQARTTTNMNLDYKHPIYCFKNGAIRQWTGSANIAYSGNLADGTGDSTHRLVTDTQITNWGTAYTNSHTHSNKSVLDTISSVSEIASTGNLADGFDDSSHRLVTDLQIDTWNAKSNFSGAYSDLTGKPTIPTTLAQLSGDSTHRVVTDTQINTWTDAYILPSGGIPFNDLSQAVQDLLTNSSALFDTEVIISDVYLKRYAAGRLMISKVE